LTTIPEDDIRNYYDENRILAGITTSSRPPLLKLQDWSFNYLFLSHLLTEVGERGRGRL